MVVAISDIVSVQAGSTFIPYPFNTVFEDTDYVIFAKAYTAPNQGIGADVVKATNGFTITVDSDATVEYFARGEGVQAVTPTAVQPLSRDWTYRAIWREIIRDTKPRGVLQHEKFFVINRAILNVVSRFYALMQRSYLTDETVAVGTNDVINLDNFRIMRTGEPITLTIDSTATKSVHPMTDWEFNSFRADDIRNRDLLAFNFRGEKIDFKRGEGLVSCEDCRVSFPRIPYFGALDETKIDVPDGAAIPIVILAGKRIVVERYGGEKPPMQPEMAEEAVRGLYQSFNHRVVLEKVKEDVQALA